MIRPIGKDGRLNNRDYDISYVSGFYDSGSRFENSLASNLFDNPLESLRGGPNSEGFENYAAVSDEVNQSFSKELTIAPKQTIEIEIPLEAAPNFGVTFMANPGVSVSLLNEKGVLVSRNLKDSPLANMLFRMIMTNKPVTRSVWKLKLENTTDLEQVFAGFGWSLASGIPKD